MQIKRFEADSISQALKAVKAEFGAEAVILETRKLGGRRKGIQVTAAVEPRPAAPRGTVAKRALATLPAEHPRAVVDPPWARDAAPRGRPERPAGAGGDGAFAGAGLTLTDVHAALSPLRDEITALGADLKAAVAGADTGHPDMGAVRADLARLRALVSDLVVDRRAAALAEGPRRAYHALTARGVPGDLAADLAAELPDGDPARLAETLAGRIGVAGPLLAGSVPARVLLAGPTGVGKTTTIAKLAAHFAITEKRRVALVTLDTYRIGAVEQLATYARIIGVPCAVASGAEELKQRLKEHAGAELVLIDTAGRSPRDPDHVAGLKAVVPPEVAVQLVLPATRSADDHAAILAAYAPLHPNGLILTKLDEAERLGAAVHTAVRGGVGVSYLTDGQRIPDDLQLASGARLAARLLADPEARQETRQDAREAGS